MALKMPMYAGNAKSIERDTVRTTLLLRSNFSQSPVGTGSV